MLPELFPDLLPEKLPEKLPEQKLPEKLPVTRVTRNFADVHDGPSQPMRIIINYNYKLYKIAFKN